MRRFLAIFCGLALHVQVQPGACFAVPPGAGIRVPGPAACPAGRSGRGDCWRRHGEREDALLHSVMKLPAIDIKLELQTMGVDHRDAFEKEDLARRLVQARLAPAPPSPPDSPEMRRLVREAESMGVEEVERSLRRMKIPYSRLSTAADLARMYANAVLSSDAKDAVSAVSASTLASGALFKMKAASMTTRELLDSLESMGGVGGDDVLKIMGREELEAAYLAASMKLGEGEKAGLRVIGRDLADENKGPLGLDYAGEYQQNPSFSTYSKALRWAQSLTYDDVCEELRCRGVQDWNAGRADYGYLSRLLADAVMIEGRLDRGDAEDDEELDEEIGPMSWLQLLQKGKRGRRGGAELEDNYEEWDALDVMNAGWETVAAVGSGAATVTKHIAGTLFDDGKLEGRYRPAAGKAVQDMVTSPSSKAAAGILGRAASAGIRSVEAAADWAGGGVIEGEHVILGISLFCLTFRRGIWSAAILLYAVRSARVTAQRFHLLPSEQEKEVPNAVAGATSQTRRVKRVLIKRRRKQGRRTG
jgi:hypothetical protein